MNDLVASILEELENAAGKFRLRQRRARSRFPVRTPSTDIAASVMEAEQEWKILYLKVKSLGVCPALSVKVAVRTWWGHPA